MLGFEFTKKRAFVVKLIKLFNEVCDDPLQPLNKVLCLNYFL